jgi:ketosteroid isomerase-like protein
VYHRDLSLPLIAIALLIAGCAASPVPRRHADGARTAAAPPGASATEQVIAAERAFARSMADRNFGAFAGMLSSEAIFFNGNTVMHGTTEIAAGWQPYFKGAKAPFAWQPDHVEVLPSGKLALSTGPVYIAGQVVGRFNSIWRLEESGTWRIVFDKGEAVCDASPPGQPDFSRLSP